MIFRRLICLLLFLLLLPPTHSHLSLSLASTFHSQEFNVVSDNDGVPQLELGDTPARDPENVLDTQQLTPRPTRNRPSTPPLEIPSASSEFFDDEIDDPIAPPQRPPEHDDFIEPSFEPPTPTPSGRGKLDIETVPGDGPDSFGPNGPETAVTIDPLAPDPDLEITVTREPTHSSPYSPLPDASTHRPSLPPLPSSGLSTSAASPLPSNIASPKPEVISVPVLPPPLGPSVTVISSSSPLPSIFRDPAASPQITTIMMPSPSPTKTSSVRYSPSPSLYPAPFSMTPGTSVSPSLSALPSPSYIPRRSVSITPSVSYIPTPRSSNTPSPSATPQPTVSTGASSSQRASPSAYVSPSPMYSSTDSDPSVTAIPPNYDSEESPSMNPSSSASILPSASPPSTVLVSIGDPRGPEGVTAFQGTAGESPQITVVLPAPPSPDASPVSGASPITIPSPSETAVPVPVSPVVPVVSPAPSTSDSGIVFLPGPEDQFTCIYFGIGLIPELLSPEPSFFSGNFTQFAVAQNNFPDLAPQYLSHTFGESWSYSVPVDVNVSYAFVLAFAEVYDVACDAGPGFRNFTVSVQDQSINVDIIGEVGCGNVLKKEYDDVVSSTGVVEVFLQGNNQNALLNTLCYRPITDTLSSPVPSPAAPSPSAVAISSPSPVPSTTQSGTDIVSPDDQYQCLNFGLEAVESFALFDPASISGEFSVYSGPAAVASSPSLPLPYLTHVFGKEWTYFLNVATTAPQRVVLGFAEVFSGACINGSGFRTFTVSIAGDDRFVDVMDTAGCGAVEQISFENVNPISGIIEVTFSSIANKAILSVLCFKDAETVSIVSPGVTPAPSATAIASASPSPPSSPSMTIAVPPAAPPSTSPPGTPTPALSPSPVVLPSPSSPITATEPPPGELRTCFRFGEEAVEGFFNVLPPGPGSGVSFFNNPFAVVQGTPFNGVYGSHIFGAKFTFSVNTGSVAIKSVELGFAEVFEPGCLKGFRVFTVEIGSVTRTVDVFDEAGCSTALNIRFDGVVPSASGVIDIVFTAVENFAMVSAVCIIENDVGTRAAAGAALKDADGNTIASVTTGQPNDSQVPSPSPMESPEASQPSVSPSPSLYPKENGIIIVAPTNTPETSGDAIIVGPGLPSEDIGEPGPGNTPTPTSILYPSNLTSTTVGSGGSPQPLPSPIQINPSASNTPNGNAVAATATATPTIDITNLTPSMTPLALPSIGPTQTPVVSTPASPSPVAILPSDGNETGSRDEDDEDASGTPDPNATTNEVPTAVPPLPANSTPAPDPTPSTSTEAPAFISGSQLPSGSASPSTFFESEEALNTPVATPSPSSSLDDSSTILVDGEEPEYSLEPDSESPDYSPEAAVTAVPPAQTASSEGSDTADPGSSDGGVTIGIVQGTTEAEFITPSPANTSLVDPSPINSRQPILPPVDPPLPSPSALPVAIVSPLPESGPTVTPTPSFSVAATATPSFSISAAASVALLPVTSGSAQLGESPDPNPTPDSPVLPLPGETSLPNTTPSGSITPGEPSTPTPSQVSSSTGASEVITVSTGTPSALPLQTATPPDPAPPKPITSVPENSTDAIGVPEGTEIEETGENNDLTGDGNDEEGPIIVAGPFMDLIGTKPEGSGFSIGMGVLGGLLVLLLLVCLFFAIFRGRGGSYSYSSQYSAHKPTDYDPSQGGYTDDLGLGPANEGNDSLYGGEGQTGYSGGGGTFESRPQTQNGSFTYEGAGEGLGGTVGSGYGLEPRDDESRPASASAYTNMQPDTFNEYTSLNVQSQTGMGKSQGANSGDFTFNDTITMPNTALYSGSRDDPDRLTSHGDDITAASSRPEFRASDSFNAYHSIARPMAHESESSGKQERTMESFAFGGSPWAPHGNGDADEEDYNEDTRDSRALSMSSAPSAAPSPYEQHMNVEVADENQGNVFKGNPTISRTPHARTFLAPAARGAMRASGRVDTEPCDDTSLCDENPATGTGADAGLVHDTFPQPSAPSDNASNDGPWPSWWSSSKQSLVPAGTYLGERSPHPHSSLDDDGIHGKENETKTSYDEKRSAFEMNSQEAPITTTATTALRNVTPLAPSSRSNVVTDEPSHFAPDSGWLRISKTSGKGFDDGDARPNGDFDELRKRRQPYVKSVANRLSVGPQSFSTSITGESGLEQARKEYEQEQLDSKVDPGRSSSSWITKNPIHI